MILNTLLNDQQLTLNVPDQLIAQAEGFFARMDQDMDKGWQVNREWVEQPNAYLRGQIAANKLLTALENEDHKLGRLMAGYILSRFPDIQSLELSEQGETRDHVLNLPGTQVSQSPSLGFSHQGLPGGLDENQAMAQANKDVSGVFKRGKQHYFSVFNHAHAQWHESPAFAQPGDAEKAREQVFKQRLDALVSG